MCLWEQGLVVNRNTVGLSQQILLFITKIEILRKHCVKYVEIRAFSDPYFDVYEKRRFRIFSHIDRIRDIRDYLNPFSPNAFFLYPRFSDVLRE